MSWVSAVRRWVRVLFRRSAVEREMREEFEFHLDMEVADRVREGLSPEEARRAPLVSFGGVERYKEEGRAARGGQWLDDLQRDVRRAGRQLRNHPGYTFVALAMLALGIGANTAIFSVIHAVLVDPLPFGEPDRLVQVWESHVERGWDRFSFSQPNAIDVRDLTTSFSSVGVVGGMSATLTGDGPPTQIGLGTVTPGFFATLGVRPLVGRAFREEDLGAPGEETGVALLSEDLWVNRFGADPAMVGRTVSIEDRALEVVGVLPRGEIWMDGDAYVPMALDSERSRSDHRWRMIARLADGITIEAAQSELDRLAVSMEERYGGADEDMGFVVDPSSVWAAGDDLRRSLWIFMGAAGLLLLIACLNLANLQLARLGGRLQQVTLSVALGAGYGRIVRQLFTESAVLAVLGGAAGVLAAQLGLRGLIALEPGSVPRMGDVEINGAVLLFALAVSLAIGMAAGLLPAARLWSGDVGSALREGGTKTVGGRTGTRVRAWLVGTETALSLVLLVGAGLLVRSLLAVQSVDNGFDPEGRITFEVPVPASYGFDEHPAFRQQFLDRLRSLPQVEAAGAVSLRPVGGGNTVMGILPLGETPESFGGNLSANWRATGSDYFRAMGLSILRGQDLDYQVEPTPGGMDVVISESLADALWPGGDPVGRQAALWNDPERVGTVVGVVEDMRERGPEAGQTLAIYFAFSVAAWSPVHFVVHTRSEPLAVVPEARRILAEIDPDAPLSRVLTMNELVEGSTASRRFTLTLLGIFAGLALVLALAGLYGVITQSVGQRAKELGVRMALGASGGEVVGFVMRQGMRPAILGIAVGLLATWLLSRVIRSLLFEVSSTDPATYAGIAALLAAAAAAACWVPARATLRMEAASVLREE